MCASEVSWTGLSVRTFPPSTIPLPTTIPQLVLGQLFEFFEEIQDKDRKHTISSSCLSSKEIKSRPSFFNVRDDSV
jgi:hypothetical protein